MGPPALKKASRPASEDAEAEGLVYSLLSLLLQGLLGLEVCCSRERPDPGLWAHPRQTSMVPGAAYQGPH